MSKKLIENLVKMARKISNNYESKYYTGVTHLHVLRVNPTNDQYLTATKRDLPFTLEYNEAADGSFGLRFLFEIADLPGTYFSSTIYVNRKLNETNSEGTKSVFVNNKGQFAWLPTNGEKPDNMAWYDASSIRPAFKGERELSNLLTKIGAFNPKEDDYSIYNKIIESFFKKYDVSPINKFLSQEVELENGIKLFNGQCGIAGLLTVFLNEANGKKMQKVLFNEGYVGKTDVAVDGSIYVSDWTKENIQSNVEKQVKAGYGIKDFYSIKFTDFVASEPEDDDEEIDVKEDTDTLPF